MSPVFADTSYWIALLIASDDLHEVSLAQRKVLGARPVITSDLVLVELLNDFAARGPHIREAGVEFAKTLRSERADRIEPTITELFSATLELYAARPDKEWSFTDCASMLICERLGITDILTFDHHFVQAGYRALLRS